MIRLLCFFSMACAFALGCNSAKNNEQTIEGDLFFTPFRIGSFYNQPDSLAKQFKGYIDTVSATSKNEATLKELFKQLEIRKRLYAPNVDIKINDSTIYTIYLDSASYEPFRSLKHDSLARNHLKVHITAKAIPLVDRFYLVTGSFSMKVQKGGTLSEDGKFDVDYH